ncbi:hypothetical protein NEUTE1DRAFT_49364 [Neurospora tetrasperma FGSC 2508]|uniref:F-box domain-containing protein n=1 Tax=Neurospora tetrasperma (strain FGSC 2508 / ATCC MYA-4615 / P0657) TaxID=510951 RepID=F8MVR4_NEUT8|nr:uncharacterized protein NEUTE1DRAFT_49364 [Neurospora tetrasperma FGSC 2508]EGO54815.1 hypothetical protein NEUTE1DRAFT_49364 [Neurospora tetrasperma FGSC 2508]
MSPTSFLPYSDPKTLGFLDLPLEIRIFIYRDVVLQPDTIELSRRRPVFECLQEADTTAILSLNQQTRAEALDVFYSENTFRIVVADEENEDLLSMLPQAVDRLPIRRLELTHPVIASSLSNTMLYRPDVDNKTWMSVLSNLRSLCIIVVEPETLPVHEEVVIREEGEGRNSMISLRDVKSFYSQLVAQSLESSRSTLVSLLTLRI